MATYKKPTISVDVATLMGYDFLGDGSALEAIKAHKTIELRHRGKVLVPFHAVASCICTTQANDATKTDPYCE